MSLHRPVILLAFHWYLESLHEGALMRCSELGFEAEVLNADSAERLAKTDFAGVVGMFPSDANHPVSRFVAATDKPVVELSLAYPENTAWCRYPEDCRKIAEVAAARLRRLPVRGFVFVSGGPWWNHDARWSVFRDALRDDARPCVRFDAGGMDAAARARLAGFLKQRPGPVAVFGSVDEWAKLAVDAALDAGLRVPGDVYALGFGNRELVSRLAAVPISSIDIDYRAWARAAVDLLDELRLGRVRPGTVRAFAPGAIVERAGTAGESGGDPLCERALELMRGAVANPPAVPELAKRLGVSKATLERAFMRSLGCGVARRFLEVRVDAAKARLAAGEKAESVAVAVGFDSYRGFVKAFTRMTGAGPGELSRAARRRGGDSSGG